MAHRHICGIRALFATEEPPRQVNGCGFTWEHPRVIGDSDDEYREKHMCPNCGIGPWYAVATEPHEVLRPLSPLPPRVAFGRIVRPAEDNPAYINRDELEEFYAYARSGNNKTERELNRLIESIIGPSNMPADGMAVIFFDEENHSITGYNIKPGRSR